MPSHFTEVEGFFNSITGGGNAFNDAAYNASLNRLIRQRSAQTTLDSKLEKLIRDKDINANRSDIRGLIDDDLLRATVLGGAGTGANLAAGRRAEGTDIENDIMRQALAAVTGAEQGGQQVPADLLNALNAVRGKLLGPQNVQVQPQATADLNFTNQQIDTSGALELSNAALEQKRIKETAAINPGPDLEALTTNQLDLLSVGPDTIPVDTTPGFFKRETIENLPLSDPRAANKFAKMTEDERDALMQFLGPEFAQWRVARLTTDPDMIDSSHAIGKYLEERVGGGLPAAGRPAPVAGESAIPNPVVPTSVAPEDIEAVIAKANALIQAGASQEEVRARLKEMGISLQ